MNPTTENKDHAIAVEVAPEESKEGIGDYAIEIFFHVIFWSTFLVAFGFFWGA